MENFYGLTLTQLESIIGALGKEKYRSRQLFKWIYNKNVLEFGKMTDLSKSLINMFKDMFFLSPLKTKDVFSSKDGTMKFAFVCDDGNIVESVLIPDKDRLTLCLSSQIGCRMGCRFCVTGRIGFIRNLKTSEIIGQLMGVRQHPGVDKITNIVLMGMGEPLDNFDNVMPALEIMKEPSGLDFSHRRITLSTVGLIGVLKSVMPKTAGIAISLNAADDKTRSELMPINRLYPIEEIVDFVRNYKADRRTRITFEYVLINGVNDSLEDAEKLAKLLKGLKCKINLIPYNESPFIDFKRPSEKTVERFHNHLINRYYTTIVRDSRGGDIHGACGQLGMRYLDQG
ncbi:MAG: 23S rRNA (adenine(2503)-C(2))-methyltransferase RlmN [Syntrophorhabdaceae bacterium]|nr:23S rRNA (adenine(2503)-C(2))-methyltransferase RlmN [Syntrophorhabdaceae bacterium]